MRYRDECMSLDSSVDTVYTTYSTTFAWRSLTGTISLLVFHVENVFLFLVHLLLAISQTNRVCNGAHRCVCSYSYLYYLYKYKLCQCARTTTPSRPWTQPLVLLLCGVFWRSNCSHYLMVFVMRVRLPCLPMYVRTYRYSIIKCTTTMMSCLLRYHVKFQ